MWNIVHITPRIKVARIKKYTGHIKGNICYYILEYL